MYAGREILKYQYVTEHLKGNIISRHRVGVQIGFSGVLPVSLVAPDRANPYTWGGLEARRLP